MCDSKQPIHPTIYRDRGILGRKDKVFYNRETECWECENVLSEVGNYTDFMFWFSDFGSAEKACEDRNKSRVTDIENITSPGQYMIFVCKNCGKEYIMGTDELQWFMDHGLSIPKRCSRCRKKR